MKIIITGGSGFVGSNLAKACVEAGHSVTVVDAVVPRNTIEGVNYIQVNLMRGEVPSVFALADAVVHLAGANIFEKWTEKYKKLIVDSRVKSAEAMYNFVSKSAHKPSVFISASAVGYYGDRGEEMLGELAQPGNDFLAEVCEEWESSAKKFETLGVRAVSVRTAIVLGPNGGMLSKLMPVFKWGLGGPMGSGEQWFSWIHINDLVRVYMEALTNTNLHGAVNASAGPVRNKDFVKALGKALGRPAFIPAPAVLLRAIFGEFAEAILGSQRVMPIKLHSVDFVFNYPTIEAALSDLK